jgi:acyl carrier protein
MGEPQDRGQILELIAATLKEVDPNLGEIPEDAVLSGANAVVDSIGFVNFLVSLEQALDQRVDLASVFMEQSEVDPADSPFRTVASLTNWITNMLGA